MRVPCGLASRSVDWGRGLQGTRGIAGRRAMLSQPVLAESHSGIKVLEEGGKSRDFG